MNSLLGQGGFQPAKCKTQLRLGTARIKLLRNKKLSQIASDRREVAEFLRNGQESNARLRVEHIIREQNLIEGYDLLFVYAERITAQLTVIDSQKTCPPELREDISTLLYGSSRCAELTDFSHIRPMFVAKYGKEFVSAAEELRPGCGVNGRVVEKLSVSRASGEAKLQMMKDIAAEHNVQWDPAPFEDEIRAVPDDLLDGPTKFTSAEPIDDFPSVPNQKPTLGTHLAQPDNFTNSNSGRIMEHKVEPTFSQRPVDDYRTSAQGAGSGPPIRFMEDKVEPTNSPRPVDVYRTGLRGVRSGPPTRKPPGLEQSRTEDLSFDDRHTDMDPGRRETQTRKNSRRESDNFLALSSQARHQDEESRRNSIGVPREKSSRGPTGSAFGDIDESLPHEYTKLNRRESHGAAIDDFDGSQRSDRRQSQKYDRYEGKGQVREANAEPSFYTRNSQQARTCQEELNHTSDEDEQGVFARTRPGADGGRTNQTRQDQDLEEVNYRTVSRKEGSGKPKPRRVHNPEWDSEVFRNSVTTRAPRNTEDEYHDSGKGSRRDSLGAWKKDNEKSISDIPHYDSSEHEDDPRGGGARKPEQRHSNFKGTNTRDSDRSSESGEEGSRQSTRRTSRLPSVDERRRDTLDDPGSSRGKRYGREDPDSLKTPRNHRSGNDQVNFDDENFTTTSRTEKRMSLPGGSVRNKSKYQGNRASDNYDDTVKPSGRRATIGPEEIRPARVRETEDPPPSRYGEREKQSDRRLSAPLPKDDIIEGRQSPNYFSQRDRPDRHRKGDIPAGYDDDRPPRFSNPKVGLQASLDDEHSPNRRVPRDRSDRPRKSDILPRYDDDKPPPRFIKVGKQSTLDDEDLPSGWSSSRVKGEKPQRFINSPRRSDEPLQATPRPRSNLQSVKTDPDLASAPKTPAPEHRKTQSASDGQPQSKPVFMKPPDLDVLIQMFGNKGKKK